ncbi:MAG: hypothetical protein A2Z11_02545 [Candidatus Woykebacteria bacterium RBG_16_43_9]|uniref:Uncharacterized protein n=1 Tax=Candidatus Woykebacteria bacterium RBG_16_43_9 TaxID=1802596 RepID=A0A1G1WFK1_9BACT|nr:MAG: hypothetical protein A2Z11_02545 [Candidatus Woykebacteria bacterium RBG_16_43_9]
MVLAVRSSAKTTVTVRIVDRRGREKDPLREMELVGLTVELALTEVSRQTGWAGFSPPILVNGEIEARDSQQVLREGDELTVDP